MIYFSASSLSDASSVPHLSFYHCVVMSLICTFSLSLILLREDGPSRYHLQFPSPPNPAKETQPYIYTKIKQKTAHWETGMATYVILVTSIHKETFASHGFAITILRSIQDGLLRFSGWSLKSPLCKTCADPTQFRCSVTHLTFSNVMQGGKREKGKFEVQEMAIS